MNGGHHSLPHTGPMPSVRNAIKELGARLFPSIVRAVIMVPVIIYTGSKVTLSTEKSKSSVADIVSYNWQLTYWRD